MWIFSKYGMLSCVCAQNRDAKANRKAGAPRLIADLNLIMIRARERETLADLIALVNSSPNTSIVDAMEHPPSPLDIVETTQNDYRFRILVCRPDFESILLILSRDVEYTNFKNEVYANQGKSLYEVALHQIWSIMYAVQGKKYGPGIYDRLPSSHTWAGSLDDDASAGAVPA